MDPKVLEVTSFFYKKQQYWFKQPYLISMLRGPNFVILEDLDFEILISERTLRKAKKELNLEFGRLLELEDQKGHRLNLNSLERKQKFLKLLAEK